MESSRHTALTSSLRVEWPAIARFTRELHHDDVDGPVCGASAGTPCPDPSGHRPKRKAALDERVRGNHLDITFREGLVNCKLLQTAMAFACPSSWSGRWKRTSALADLE